LCVGGYASADSAEEHGGTTGFARGAPLRKLGFFGFCSLNRALILRIRSESITATGNYSRDAGLEATLRLEFRFNFLSASYRAGCISSSTRSLRGKPRTLRYRAGGINVLGYLKRERFCFFDLLTSWRLLTR